MTGKDHIYNMSKYKKFVLKLQFKYLVLVIISIVVSFFLWQKMHVVKLAIKPAKKVVDVSLINKQDFRQTIVLLGNIHTKYSTLLKAKGDGTLKILMQRGQKIKQGSLIAKIENLDLEKSLELSTTTEALAKKQYERLLPLLRSGFASIKESEEKKQSWLSYQKEVSKTKMALENLRFYAPFDGIIGAYKKRDGAEVRLNEELVSIYDPKSLVVDFDIPCANYSELKAGQPVSVLNKSYKLNHIQQMMDDETHMCPADVDIECQSCLIGDTIKVELVVASKKDVIVIPSTAIFLKESNTYVYIVENGKVELEPVKTGLSQKQNIEIVEGLKVSQKLIIKGMERLHPGMEVDIFKNDETKII